MKLIKSLVIDKKQTDDYNFDTRDWIDPDVFDNRIFILEIIGYRVGNLVCELGYYDSNKEYSFPMVTHRLNEDGDYLFCISKATDYISGYFTTPKNSPLRSEYNGTYKKINIYEIQTID